MSRPRQCADCGTTNAGGAWIGQGSAFGGGTRWRCGNCQTRNSAEAAEARRTRDTHVNMELQDAHTYRAPTGFAPSGTKAPKPTESSDPSAWYGGRGSLLHPSLHAAASELKDKLAAEESQDSPSSMARKMLEQRSSQDTEMEAWRGILNDRRKK